MLPELGTFSLILALCLASILGVAPLIGAWRADQRLLALARPLSWGQFALVSIAFILLIIAFINNDFSVTYVAHNSNSRLPLFFRIAASWGGHEGSLLLWIFVLTAWTVAVARYGQQLSHDVQARVLAVMGLINVGFLSFTLFTSNPFLRSVPAALDGRDLNPLLQDIGMIIHPPMLYMGYVGFSVAFAFAIAGLLKGELDENWAKWSRPWTLVAWAFLTIGIFLGSFWAYYELGWGGWWFWDAVENASFMPWLLGTALIHSLAVSEKRASFKNWAVLLAILCFSLSLLGTFLVRSGVLTSVHAFASDPKRGLFILAFLVIVVGGSLSLYAWRAGKLETGKGFHWFSRDAGLLLNNLFLFVAAAAILLGTLYPLFLDALHLGKISVGPPYFDTVFVPLMLPILFFVAIGPYLSWKQTNFRKLFSALQWIIFITFLTAALLFFVLKYSALLVISLSLAAWIVLATINHLIRRLRHRTGDFTLWRSARSFGSAYWGMLIAHLGIAIFLTGVSLVKGLEQGQDLNLRVGQQVEIAGLSFRFDDLRKIDGPNYIAASARFLVTDHAGKIHILEPERRIYTVQNMPMTEAAIDRGFARDLYVSLGEANQDQSWIVKIQIKPFISWIWFGCAFIALGGLFAAFDERYRHTRQHSRVPQSLPSITDMSIFSKAEI
ncbi:heme lyase CcmF/NrfE family subunit [Undibacterium flavidum]|uniref:Heme lyase CcmF/NrfE family subunit n=1 Tax=Undibacterium flavidum TaxID=2762297 RepID=A0ABR6YAJ9_9BURK|nr:heme lyase CcmF/NrfE family subunit [Undibacterium flavidum]MBC3873174.1 heme lyase CcmF/NrfE family subunit [Undibacterium flavidum]